MSRKCQMCHNFLHFPPPWEPVPVTSRITIETPEGTKTWKVDAICAALMLQQICEINGCQRKAEYSITRWHGLHIVVCREHFPRIGELDAMDEEELK